MVTILVKGGAQAPGAPSLDAPLTHPQLVWGSAVGTPAALQLFMLTTKHSIIV